jgi:hypothetical protein
MTLNCTMQNGGKKTVSIPISPPLKGYEDVKDRLLEMKALAQEGLGMVWFSSAFSGHFSSSCTAIDPTATGSELQDASQGLAVRDYSAAVDIPHLVAHE